MPIIKRHIDPVFVSRTPIPPQVSNELECGTNSTLSNIIRQLSSLSRFAEDLFAELAYEANSIYTRAVTLQQRGERLRAKVGMLNSNQDEVSIHDIHLRKPFRSSGHLDQQVVNRTTMPHALQETYDGSDPPPALYKFNPYRDDGRDSMKFYTDSTYFLEIWAQEMNRDMEKHRKQRRPRQRPSPRHEVKQPRPIMSKEQQYQHLKHGVDLMPEVPDKGSNDVVPDHINNHDMVRPSTLELARPNGELVKPSSDSGFISMPPGPIDSSSSESSTPGPRRPTVLPPAPPPPVHRPVQSPPAPPVHRSVTGESLDLPPPPSPLLARSPAPSPPPDSFVPPPPPPPPPPVAPPASWGMTEPTVIKAAPIKAAPIKPPPQPEPIPDESARSDLLLQIQRGIQLRKVEQQCEKPRLSNGLIDVKELMDRAFESRRKAMEDSSSEEESVSEWDDE